MRNAKNRQPVLMLHGVVGSSQDFTFTGPGFNNQSDGNVTGKGIPFQLVDTNKYDVWMMNARGNPYSKQHLWLDAETEPDFWNFSFEEIGKYDLPACIDYLQKERKDKEKVMLIGYSQGTTVATFGLSELPNYFDKKVSLFIALAPSVLFKNSTEPSYKSMSKETVLQEVLLLLDYDEISMN